MAHDAFPPARRRTLAELVPVTPDGKPPPGGWELPHPEKPVTERLARRLNGQSLDDPILDPANPNLADHTGLMQRGGQ
jgi:hypothetical protein